MIEKNSIETIDDNNKIAWEIRRSEHERSTNLALEALNSSQALGYNKGIAFARLTLALQHAYRNEYKEALLVLDEVLERMKRDGLTDGLLKVMNTYGYIYVNISNFAKALPYLLSALELSKEIDDKEVTTMILFNLAEIYKDESMRQYQTALDYYLEAEKYSKCSTHDIYTLILSSIASMYHKLGQQEAAFYYADAAFNATANLKECTAKNQSYQVLAHFYHENGDFAKAEDAITKGIELHKEMLYRDLQVQNHLLYAKIKIATDDDEAAAEALATAYEKALIIDIPSLLSEISELYADLLMRQARHAEAASFYKQAIIARDRQYEDSLTKHINAISTEMKLEQAKKDTEIHRLKNIELKAKSEELTLALEELKETQAQLIQNEKMAALGGLISGIAHEINSPFGAIQGSISNIQNYTSTTLSADLPKLLLRLDKHNQDLFFKLLIKSMERNMLMTSKEERQLMKNIREQLETLAFSNAAKLSEKLVDLGITEEITVFLPLLQLEYSSELLDTCYKLSGILRNVENIRISVAKAEKVIKALRYYTHFSQTESFIKANISEGIESVLQLFYNQFKGGVEVIQDFSNLPEIECHLDELNQTWMNLIQNALQAMSFKGLLKITGKYLPEEKKVCIEIEDNGPGIPAEIRDRIFLPFFTTKKSGEGSGLGLSFVKKTIEKHNGVLKLDSNPGKTVFTVLLPTSQLVDSTSISSE